MQNLARGKIEMLKWPRIMHWGNNMKIVQRMLCKLFGAYSEIYLAIHVSLLQFSEPNWNTVTAWFFFFFYCHVGSLCIRGYFSIVKIVVLSWTFLCTDMAGQVTSGLCFIHSRSFFFLNKVHVFIQYIFSFSKRMQNLAN